MEAGKNERSNFYALTFMLTFFRTKYLTAGVPVAGLCFQAEKICLFMLRQEFLLKNGARSIFFEKGEKFIMVNNPKLKKTIFF